MANDPAGSMESRLAAIESVLEDLRERIGRLEAVPVADVLSDPLDAIPGELENGAEIPEPEGRIFDIVNFKTKIIESQSTWVRYAWKLLLKNRMDRHLQFEATINYSDADGFVIHDDTIYDLEVTANQQNEFRGYHEIEPAIAGKVRSVSVSVRMVSNLD